METLGDRIERLRNAKQLTQQQLAKIIGVSRVAVTKWESGATKNMKLDNLLALCDLFELGAESLISGTYNLHVRQDVTNYRTSLHRLTPSEFALLKAYNAAPVEVKMAVDRVLLIHSETNSDFTVGANDQTRVGATNAG
jgi:transcriptional regulator with XRE-family HTH domain